MAKRAFLVRRAFVPDRGDVIWIEMNPQPGQQPAGQEPAGQEPAGQEQADGSPALVLSPAAYNRKTSLAVLCPITSQMKGYPFEIELAPAAGVAGVVLADQVRSLDWRARRAAPQGRLPAAVVDEILAKLAALLGL